MPRPHNRRCTQFVTALVILGVIIIAITSSHGKSERNDVTPDTNENTSSFTHELSKRKDYTSLESLRPPVESSFTLQHSSVPPYTTTIAVTTVYVTITASPSHINSTSASLTSNSTTSFLASSTTSFGPKTTTTKSSFSLDLPSSIALTSHNATSSTSVVPSPSSTSSNTTLASQSTTSGSASLTSKTTTSFSGTFTNHESTSSSTVLSSQTSTSATHTLNGHTSFPYGTTSPTQNVTSGTRTIIGQSIAPSKMTFSDQSTPSGGFTSTTKNSTSSRQSLTGHTTISDSTTFSTQSITSGNNTSTSVVSTSQVFGSGNTSLTTHGPTISSPTHNTPTLGSPTLGTQTATSSNATSTSVVSTSQVFGSGNTSLTTHGPTISSPTHNTPTLGSPTLSTQTATSGNATTISKSFATSVTTLTRQTTTSSRTLSTSKYLGSTTAIPTSHVTTSSSIVSTSQNVTSSKTTVTSQSVNTGNTVTTSRSTASITTSGNPSSTSSTTYIPVWTPPPSLAYIQANAIDRNGNKLIPENAYGYIKNVTQHINPDLILPADQGGDCRALPDDPCIDAKRAMKDPNIKKTVGCKKDKCDDKDDHDHLAIILGSVGGGVSASTIGAFAWFRHRSGWKIGEFLFHRSRSLFDLFKIRLPPADVAKFGFEPLKIPEIPHISPPSPPEIPELPPIAPPSPPPLPPVSPPPPSPPSPPSPPIPPAPPLPPSPPLVPLPPSPPLPPTPPTPPPPPGNPEDPNNHNDNDNDQEDPDDGTFHPVKATPPPTTPRRDPPVIRKLLTRGKNPDCPPKLKKAEQDLKLKAREIRLLKRDLREMTKYKEKYEADFKVCDIEMRRLHEVQERTKRIGDRGAARELREANDRLKHKLDYFDLMVELNKKGDAANMELEEKLKKAREDLEKAKEEQEAALRTADDAMKQAKAAQEQVKLWVDTSACFQKTLDPSEMEPEAATGSKELEAFRKILEATEQELQTAKARAAEAEGVRAALEARAKELQDENTQMAQHTCPDSILSQPITCGHTNEEIARMKFNLEACNYDRQRLRKPDLKPQPAEDNLPLQDQLERCKKRWRETLAQKASLSNEYGLMTQAARKEIKRLKGDLADCRRQIGQPGNEPRPTTTTPPKPEDSSVASRIKKLEAEVAKCEKEKAALEKGQCPAPHDGTSEAEVTSLKTSLADAMADADTCFSQCDCPAGVSDDRMRF